MAPHIPQAPEAEAAVLGAVLLRNAAFDAEGVSDLQPDDFHLPRHRVVWEAMRTLLMGGDKPDVVLLEDLLRSTGNWDTAGGYEGLGKLSDRVFLTPNVTAHARIVAAKARARRAQRLMSEAAEKLSIVDADDLDDFLASTIGDIATARSSETDGFMHFGQVCDAALDHAKARKSGDLVVYPWGMPSLDAIFDGGMMRGRLIVVAARPGMGKTVLGMQVAFESARRGETPLVFSLEMLPEQLGQRAIASLGQVDMKAVKEPSTEREWTRMAEAREWFHRHAGDVWTKPTHLDQMITIVRSWSRRTRKPGPIVIDYLQLIRVVGRGRLDTTSRIVEITRDLKQLALEVKLPIVLLSQLNRDCERRDDKRPMIADLKSSGSIEEDADAVAFLYRDRVYNQDSDPLKAEIIVRKNRDALTGTAEVRFEGHFSRFLDTSHDVRPEPGWEYTR